MLQFCCKGYICHQGNNHAGKSSVLEVNVHRVCDSSIRRLVEGCRSQNQHFHSNKLQLLQKHELNLVFCVYLLVIFEKYGSSAEIIIFNDQVPFIYPGRSVYRTSNSPCYHSHDSQKVNVFCAISRNIYCPLSYREKNARGLSYLEMLQQ